MKLEVTLKKFNSLNSIKYAGQLKDSFKFTDEPKFYQFSCYSPDSKIESSALDLNEKKAKVRTLFEYIERFCLYNPSKKLFYEKYYNFREDALDPCKLMNFREEEIGMTREDYFEILRTSNISWVKGKDENLRKNIFIPAQQVYLTRFFEEPLIRPRISTGAAAHEDYQEAIYNGIMENIERDSYMLRYLSKDKIPKIELDGELKELENYFNRYILDLNIFETTSDLNIPSFMCINIDRSSLGPSISVGLKADLNPRKAIKGCIMESQQVRQWIRYLYYKDKSKKIVKKKDILETKDRGLFWYNVNNIERVNYLIKNPKIKSINEIKNPLKSKKDLISFLKEKGIDTYSVDITLKAIKELGFSVVKIIQPQMHPLFFDERLPCFYSQRLNENLNGRKINTFPHPFI